VAEGGSSRWSGDVRAKVETDGLDELRRHELSRVMSRGNPARKDTQRPCEGDIIVTAVSAKYAVGRLKAEGEMQEFLGAERRRDAALTWACALAGAKHRVFLYPDAGQSGYLFVDCGELPKTPYQDEERRAVRPGDHRQR
jgi:hypothetical protein